jgi:protein-S-isoprenylcysteine O-methyltransferase Ste14
MSDQSSPDSTKLGSWLFRHRTSLPLPIAVAIAVIPSGETSRSWVEILVGVGLTVAGEAIRMWGVHHIGVISRTRSDRLGPLVDSGPFAYVRNPLYIGNMLLWVGFAVAAGLLWLAPIAAGLLAVEYHWIVRWEETLLESRLGDAYRDYRRRVPRWLPVIGRCPTVARHVPHGSQARARHVPHGSQALDKALDTVAKTLFSERGTLIAIAAGYLLLWLKARF